MFFGGKALTPNLSPVRTIQNNKIMKLRHGMYRNLHQINQSMFYFMFLHTEVILNKYHRNLFPDAVRIRQYHRNLFPKTVHIRQIPPEAVSRYSPYETNTTGTCFPIQSILDKYHQNLFPDTVHLVISAPVHSADYTSLDSVRTQIKLSVHAWYGPSDLDTDVCISSGANVAMLQS